LRVHGRGPKCLEGVRLMEIGTIASASAGSGNVPAEREVVHMKMKVRLKEQGWGHSTRRYHVSHRGQWLKMVVEKEVSHQKSCEPLVFSSN
jgi:hypothetical protein